MTYPILEKHRTHKEQIINMFSSKFKEKNQSYQRYVAEKIFISSLIDYVLS